MKADTQTGEGALIITEITVMGDGVEPGAATDTLSTNEQPAWLAAAQHKLGSFVTAVATGIKELTRPIWSPVKEFTRPAWDAAYESKTDRAYTRYLVSLGVVPPSALATPTK